MEENAIDENINSLLDAIRESSIYKEYRKHEESLGRNPELKKRVDRFRGENYRIQNECEKDELFDIVEKMEKESQTLRGCPEVNEYLDAELALCRMLQKICEKLMNGIDISIPGII
ncbi:MAG: YlbF family regulator [Clostridia bacterium]|nr:YlbF family regulator [Clostridia bacterium]MDY5554697.1 YlbF family regulator [Blautia sp.]